jgi:hypothetical protein
MSPVDWFRIKVCTNRNNVILNMVFFQILIQTQNGGNNSTGGNNHASLLVPEKSGT